MSIILIEKFCSLVIIGLADVDRFKWCIQFAVGHAPHPLHPIISIKYLQFFRQYLMIVTAEGFFSVILLL